MILPQTYEATLILMIFGMLCLGSWANTFKLGGKWPFELYYFDFAFGVLGAALLLAFTAGSFGSDGFSFTDDLLQAGKRPWFFAFVAGGICNFGNMLLMAAISVAGMSVAFPLGIGTAVVVGCLLTVLLRGGDSMLLAGCVPIVLAMVLASSAYRAMEVLRHEAVARSGRAKSTRRPSAVKGILLSVAAGLLLGSFYPLVQGAMQGEPRLGVYSVGMLFAVAIFVSTFVFNLFLINLAVDGEVQIGQYFRAPAKRHALGVAGGMVWAVGAAATLLAGTPGEGVRVAPAAPALCQGFAVIAALWGLLAWKEFRESNTKVKALAVLMLAAYIGGVVLLSLAPLPVQQG